MKSWKTTVAGLLVLIGVAAAQVNNLLDADPLTVFDWQVVLSAAGVFFVGLFARDKNVTSEAQIGKEAAKDQAQKAA